MVRKYHRCIPCPMISLLMQHSLHQNRRATMHPGKLFQFLLSSAALSACLSASSFAADLSKSRAPAYDPFTWTGYYGGVNLGYGWGNPQTSSLITAFVEPGPGATGVLSSTASGA